MLCKGCYTKIPNNALVCETCGKEVERQVPPNLREKTPQNPEKKTFFCPHCGESVDTGRKFCNHCRKRVVPLDATPPTEPCCQHCKEPLEDWRRICPKCRTRVANPLPPPSPGKNKPLPPKEEKSKEKLKDKPKDTPQEKSKEKHKEKPQEPVVAQEEIKKLPPKVTPPPPPPDKKKEAPPKPKQPTPKAQRCLDCYSLLPENTLVCPECGRKVGDEGEKEALPPAPVAKEEEKKSLSLGKKEKEETPDPPNKKTKKEKKVDTPSSEEATPSPEKGKLSPPTLILAGIALVFVVIIGVFVAFPRYLQYQGGKLQELLPQQSHATYSHSYGEMMNYSFHEVQYASQWVDGKWQSEISGRHQASGDLYVFTAQSKGNASELTFTALKVNGNEENNRVDTVLNRLFQVLAGNMPPYAPVANIVQTEAIIGEMDAFSSDFRQWYWASKEEDAMASDQNISTLETYYHSKSAYLAQVQLLNPPAEWAGEYQNMVSTHLELAEEYRVYGDLCHSVQERYGDITLQELTTENSQLTLEFMPNIDVNSSLTPIMTLIQSQYGEHYFLTEGEAESVGDWTDLSQFVGKTMVVERTGTAYDNYFAFTLDFFWKEDVVYANIIWNEYQDYHGIILQGDQYIYDLPVESKGVGHYEIYVDFFASDGSAFPYGGGISLNYQGNQQFQLTVNAQVYPLILLDNSTVEEDMENAGDLYSYQETLELYAQALGENFGLGALQAHGISYLLAYYTKEEVGYAIMDLDGNGREELLIGILGTGGQVLDMYTATDSGIEPLLSSGEKDVHTLCHDHLVVTESNNDASRTLELQGNYFIEITDQRKKSADYQDWLEIPYRSLWADYGTA